MGANKNDESGMIEDCFTSGVVERPCPDISAVALQYHWEILCIYSAHEQGEKGISVLD